MQIDFEKLWAIAIKEPTLLSPETTAHGSDHWRRVERNGLILSTRTGAIVEIVRLFAIFHDIRRVNDDFDPEHGLRGAEFAAAKRGEWFELPDDHFELLYEACVGHTDNRHHEDPTIGTCWDADRLDLGRVGIIPSPDYMSTIFAAEIAEYGLIGPWLHLAHTASSHIQQS
jgi:uncharacterized protein